MAKFLVVYFFKSKLSPIISFLLPLLFMMVFYVAASGSDDPDAGLQLFLGSLATYISLSILPLALISMPQIIVELKNSIILRRIKNSGFTKNNFLALTFILHFLLSIAFVLIVFGLFFVFFFTMKDPNGVREQELSNINIGGLIYSILLLIVSSLSVGIFLSSVIKNVSYALISGIIVILVTITFAGQFIPIQVIGGTEAFSETTFNKIIGYKMKWEYIEQNFIPKKAINGRDEFFINIEKLAANSSSELFNYENIIFNDKTIEYKSEINPELELINKLVIINKGEMELLEKTIETPNVLHIMSLIISLFVGIIIVSIITIKILQDKKIDKELNSKGINKKRYVKN